MTVLRRTVLADAIMADLVYQAKLNKPSNDWTTSEWDRVVEAVAAAMQMPVPEIPAHN